MKVSDYLREYQATKQIPEVDDSNLHFWAGWLIGPSLSNPDKIKQAIHVAEFIEAHALDGIPGVEQIRIMTKEEVEKIWPRK